MTDEHPRLRFLVAICVSLLASVVVLFLTDATASKLNPRLEPSPFDDARGYQIFTSRCEVCHAKQVGDLSRMGPNLGLMGAEAADRRPGLNGPEYILESIMEPDAFAAPGSSGAMMPAKLVADLSDDDIRNLVAHVAQFGATPNNEEIAALVIRGETESGGRKIEVRRDTLERGEQVFREKCQACHSVHNGAEHLVYAPAIFGVGFENEQWMRNAIRHEGRPVAERYRATRVVLNDGEVLVGNLIARNPDELVILSVRPQDRGELITIEWDEIRKNAEGQPILRGLEAPPGLTGFGASLTPEEIDALVALLKAFN